MTAYFSHPLVLSNIIQARDYQLAISNSALNENTLVILPTGLGKTVVALIVMATRLVGDQKVLLVAPTKPLCEQHFTYFSHVLPYTAVRILTGELPASERLKEFHDAQVIIATPQTIENDLKSHTYTLENISLLVIDEAHRAVGGYAYTFIAGEYQATSQNPLILAMTASPGGDEEKVNAIKNALFIDRVINKSEDDPDVAPYLHEKEIFKLYLDLPAILRDASNILKRCIRTRTMLISKMGVKCSATPSMKELNRIKAEASAMIDQHNGTGYQLASVHAEIMKLRHALLIAETQGILPLRKYFEKLEEEAQAGKPKSSRTLLQDPMFSPVFNYVMKETDTEIHPKSVILPSMVKKALTEHPDSRILVFASYRDTGAYIVWLLKEAGIKAGVFHGQASKGNQKGMNQKKQIETIQKFKDGVIQVLVATSVAEEGLDIPSCDEVIFYEPVPSEVRSIQRRGRTGRFATGKVIVMITRDTQDEINYITSQRKEQSMKTMDHTTKQVKIGVEG